MNVLRDYSYNTQHSKQACESGPNFAEIVVMLHRSNSLIDVIAYNVFVLAVTGGTLPELSCQSGVHESCEIG